MAKRIVCIAGFHEISREWANQQDKAVEIWVPNEGSRYFDRIDRVFQMHPRNWREEERKLSHGGSLPANRDPDCFGRNREHVEWLRNCKQPIFMQRVWDDIPASLRYPFEEVQHRVGVPAPPTEGTRLYVTDTFAYMLALAIYEHVEGDPIQEIKVCGIELYDGREARWELPCVTFYLGMAMGYGIKLGLPPHGTSLLNAPLYAIEGPYPGTVDGENMPEGERFARTPNLIIDPVTGTWTLMPPIQVEPPPSTNIGIYTSTNGVTAELEKTEEDATARN